MTVTIRQCIAIPSNHSSGVAIDQSQSLIVVIITRGQYLYTTIPATFKLLHRSVLRVPLHTPSLLVAASIFYKMAAATFSASARFEVGRASAPVDLAIVSPENCELLDGVQRIVDEQWAKHGETIAGKVGAKAVKLQSARSSHPAFPIFASVLGATPSLANGRIPTHVST